MTAIERLTAALARSGKPAPDSKAPHHVEIVAADVLEACAACTDKEDPIVAALKMGSTGLAPDTKVVIKVDDLAYLIEETDAG